MKTIQLCPTCASPLPQDAPDGLCPQCLLKTDAPTEMGGGSGFKPLFGPEPGERFGGYHIVRLLGEGGMGSVYEAEDVENGRRVALKVLRHAPDSPTARQRFLREGRLAASVNHPHSVYIYGAEEIEGAPVITMEYVPGGTLSELVKAHGPLSVPKAVDTILQIIDGLEAAAAIGVLHRDVKPSNCFVEADGTVKVGDFGLSISTLARDQTNLTIAGAIMGTPSYAPPEQLRGDELDLRADIYSVGVTLYFLLTGQTPFNADTMVKLIATVLEKPAPSPRLLRPEIPKAVEHAVLRCLAKQPAQRFKNYDELRQALLPFSSAQPIPAPLGMRLVAGIIDRILLGLLIVSGASLLSHFPGYEHLAFDELRSPRLLSEFWPLVGQALYYALFEAFWGAGIGKYLCRLRVIGPNGGPAGLPRSFGRALIYIFTPRLAVWLLSGGIHAGFSVPEQTVGLVSVYVIHALFFVTARRRNGFASVYDLITGTRVVQRAPIERPSPQTLAQDAAPQSNNSSMVGPFHVLESLTRQGSAEILLGYDTRLLRKVWIRKQPPGTAPIPAFQRDLNRKARLHWLAGRRSADDCWDAYEAVAGQPMVSLLHTPQPWKTVRFWLLDLAEELAAARLDGSSPDTLGLDRVWITADGRAKLLDFPAPGKNGAHANSSNPSPQQFLSQVAYAGLAGRSPSEEAPETVPQIPMPLFARAFLQKLPAAPDLPSLLTELRPLLDKPAEVSSGQRRGLIYLSMFIASFSFSCVSIASGYTHGRPVPFWMLGTFALPSLTASLLFRRGLGLRLLKIEIVTNTGLPAPRWQTFLRCLLAWLPFLLLLLSVSLLERFWPFWIFLISLLGGIAYRLIHPGRAIRDRIVGTWLVPE